MPLYVGATAPYELVCTVTNLQGPSLATASSAQLDLRKPRGSEVTWSGNLSNATATTLTITHVCQPGEIDEAGDWSVYARIQTPSGELRTEVGRFTIFGEYQR